MIILIDNTLRNYDALFNAYNIYTGYMLQPAIESWLNENCGKWSLSKPFNNQNIMKFTFEEETDAVAFKLRWL